MDWVTVTWSMVAAACITLGAMHLLVWLAQRNAWAHLLFSCSAISAAVVAWFELAGMRAQTPEEYGALVRWFHPALFAQVVSLIYFVRLYLRAGRRWLAWAFVAVRALILVLNFTFTPNLHYRQITAIRQVTLLGGPIVSVAEGVPNPWGLLGQLSSLLLLIFMIDAMRTVWLRGERRRAIMLCGSTILFILIAAGHSAFVIWGVVRAPHFISVAYLGIILAMAHELSLDVAHSASLARRLQSNEAALRQSEQWFRRVVEAAPNAMVVVSAESGIVLVNKQAEALFGYSREELIGRDVESLIPEPFCAGHAACRGAYVAAPQARAMGSGRELFGRRKDGTSVPVEIGLNPVKTTDGPLVLASIIDITARRQAELEAQHQRSELAHLSRLATLGELSGSMAHELNQPLSGILSNAEAGQRFLERKDVDLDEIRAILKDIVDDDNRAGEVIRRLRLLFKKGELRREELNLNETIREVLKLMRSELVNRKVTVATELDDSLPCVSADRVQIQQVLMNLIINGCDAMADTNGRDRRLTLRSLSSGPEIHICVDDRGCGIPPDKLEKVFAPFYTTKAQGMGLGLAVCRTIITAHGGRLWATNNPDGGASCCVALPASPALGADER